VKRLFEEVHGLVWTLAGTGMVLITLSGPTLKQAILLTGVALVVHSVLTLGQKDS
jgi:hypothetical protein